MNGEIMLKLKNVSKFYYQDGLIASGITKVNLELHMGEFVVITGESGSGKSTLLNVLSGLDSYEEGEMYINGEETSHYTEEDFLAYRRKYVSNIFQNFNLVNSYSVYENIELAMLLNGKNRKDVKKYINELIEKVGLKKYRNTKVSKLSGGQKQRVAIARALANDTPIIVADEPTGALDSEAAKSILKLLASISKDKLVIVVTHNKKEIEEYATRLIRMHDGKILENKQVKKINLDSDIEEKSIKDITTISKIRLGIRNSFNIPVKFILMFIIYFIISITLLNNRAVFMQAENLEIGNGYNEYFSNVKRIIITKKDKSKFNNDDYNKLKELKNIDYIVEKDLINDDNLFIYNDSFGFGGTILLEKKEKVDVGRLPINNNELVIVGSKSDYYLNDLASEVLSKEYNIDGIDEKVRIVGIIYEDSDNFFGYNNDKFICSDYILNKKYNLLYADNSYTRIILNNNYFNDKDDNDYLNIVSSNIVPKGQAYIKDNFDIYCKDYSCENNTIKINVKNIYFEDTIELKITKEITKDNAKNLLNTNYDNIYNNLYINEEDFNNLFNKGDFQSSVFVKDVKDLDSVSQGIEKLGYNAFKIKDGMIDENKTIKQVFKIFRLIVTTVLVISLFFISYFIIKIIYKSRNSYYATIRTLGSTKRVCIAILINELLTLATFTYGVLLILIYLVQNNIIKYEYIKNLSMYVNTNDYIFVYIILILLSLLIAMRYGRKIFRDSIIKTYGERI